MIDPRQLTLDVYRLAIENTPVLCVDVVLKAAGTPQYVLFRRNNEPLKGELYVCGGRVYKGEMVDAAARRKLREELSLDLHREELRFLGFYEEVFQFSHFGRGEYHTVSIVYEAECDPTEIVLDGQHSEWKLVDALPPGFLTRLTRSK